MLKQILYGDVKSIANPMLPNLMTAQLGTDDGAQDLDGKIFYNEIGVMFSGFCGWDLMAGYSVGQNPINEQNVMFNILAPAVVENHVTFGISKDIAKNHELTVAFMYAFENIYNGPNPWKLQINKLLKLE
jgi:long-chain fatty acid transport protein